MRCEVTNKQIINNIKNKRYRKPLYLVQYKGGGFDGCFWQWNFAVLKCTKTDDGIVYEWIPIKTTGIFGAKTLGSFMNKINTRDSSDEALIISLFDDKTLSWWGNNYNAGMVYDTISDVRYLTSVYINPVVTCYKCNEKESAIECFTTEDGKDFICINCYYENEEDNEE